MCISCHPARTVRRTDPTEDQANQDALPGDNVERCVCCGEIIPEGRQVCPACEKKANKEDGWW